MNRLVIIGLTIIMFFFKNSATSNELKNFYDLEIENINGEIINIKNYENKVVLIVNTASYCGFTMSLFVGNLAFVDNMQYMDGVKIGVLTGSLLSTLFGYFLILLTPNK